MNNNNKKRCGFNDVPELIADCDRHHQDRFTTKSFRSDNTIEEKPIRYNDVVADCQNNPLFYEGVFLDNKQVKIEIWPAKYRKLLIVISEYDGQNVGSYYHFFAHAVKFTKIDETANLYCLRSCV